MKNLGERVCAEEIRNRLVQLRAEDAALWGKMSAGEMVCHVREAFRVATGVKPVAPMKTALPPGAMKWLGLSLPMQWPKNLETVRELKEGVECRPKVFAEDYDGLCKAMEDFLRTTGNRTPHAIFGTMTPKDWMRWGYLHTDHHLRQFGR